MHGILDNNTLERLDLSDNEIEDKDAQGIVRFIKRQAEYRDSALWMTGLRHSRYDQEEDHLVNLIMVPNSPNEIQNERMSRYNMRKERIKYRKGLREIIIKRNKLGNGFAEQLSGCIRYDKYIKVLDISNNLIESTAMKDLVRLALAEH